MTFGAGEDRLATHAQACASTPSGASARDSSYVGLSEQLARSVEPSGSTPGSVRAATYDYGADGMRLGRKTGEETQDATATAGFRAYDLDAQDTIVGLESEQAGEVGDADEYRYDPFGSPLNVETEPGQTPAEGELSDEARQNPFRFQGHYADADSGLYDMRARTYDPAQGRFLSQDVFQDPQADLALAADPITNDRYAFTAGNPVTRSEYDGHNPCGSGRDGRACAKGNQEKSKTGDTPQQNRERPTPREVRRQDRIVAAANQQEQQAAVAQNRPKLVPASPPPESAPATALRWTTGIRAYSECAPGVGTVRGLAAGCRGVAFDGEQSNRRPDEADNGIGATLLVVPGCQAARVVCANVGRAARGTGRAVGAASRRIRYYTGLRRDYLRDVESIPARVRAEHGAPTREAARDAFNLRNAAKSEYRRRGGDAFARVSERYQRLLGQKKAGTFNELLGARRARYPDATNAQLYDGVITSSGNTNWYLSLVPGMRRPSIGPANDVRGFEP